MTDTPIAKPIPYRLSDLLDVWQDDADAAHDAYTTGTARGPVTALPTLDKRLGGYLAPGLHVLHGGPGSGKTALALQMAGTCGSPAVYVTCEMSPLELLRRTAARVTSTFLGRFKTGELSPQASMDLARRAVAASPDLWLMDATGCYPERNDIWTAALAARGNGRHILVVVDSVHAWAMGANNGENGDTEYESLNIHLQSLNAMALALNCPVLAIAEQNRASKGQGGMSAGAGTRKLEYTAGTVMDLHKEKDAEEDPHTYETPITLRLPKNRSGSGNKSIRLLFHGPCQTFREDPWQPDKGD